MEVKSGEIHAIMGPNGTGKSTLSKVIMGDANYKILKGTIKYDDKVINEYTTDERARLGLFLSMQMPLEVEGVTNADLLRTACHIKEGNNFKLFDIDIFYDVNGKNGPNQWGHDLFEFMVKDETVYPNGIPGTQSANFDTGCAPSDSKGYGCAAWVIYKGNFEYLKCDDLE